MGLLDLLKGVVGSGGSKSGVGSGVTLECQNCKAKIDSGMERCPNCGVHLSSMFRIKCPKCGTTNQWNAEKCEKCGTSFRSAQSSGKSSYKCPRCGYVADYFMMSCPSCGVKFV
ncbi:MAG: zinc ribbon domain-containing protein [Candidatus Micrarchaeia archaeon]